MKKKGFTLIELIVVIAIIGVLAAILVPAMLGYVKKSKITTANTTAKSIYNAMNTALVDMDTEDKALPSTQSVTSINGSGWTASASDDLQKKVFTYFSDITKVADFSYAITDGACTGVGVRNGVYPGSYPRAMTVDEYNTPTVHNTGYASSADALAYAIS